MTELHTLQTLAEHSDVYRHSQRIAIIDMGTNSFRLIVIEYVPRLSFKMVDEVREAVRLGEGMAEANILRAPAMDRASRAMQIYAAFCRASGITNIVAAGTSAIRDAGNRDRFLARIQAETGITPRVLSGEEEAYFGYLAAVNSTTLENGFVVDLGGGSLQITRVENRRSVKAVSFPLGAVRVTEGFLPGDPPKSSTILKFQHHLREKFGALDWFKREPGMKLVGEGGTLRLVGRLTQKIAGYPLDELHGYYAKRSEVETVCSQLAKLAIEERKKMSGMKADRADISLGGALVIQEVLRAGDFDEMMICNQGLREGIFYERFLANEGIPIFENIRRASVLNLAHLYRFQEKHAEHIAHLTLSMFDQIQTPHNICGPVERELLWAASMLHDIGVSVDYNDHHKHSAYLILNAGLPGYTHREIALIALLARYHRKGKPTLDEFSHFLNGDDEKCLLQLSALLRLAEQMDRSRDGVVHDVVITMGTGWAQMELMTRGDGQVALWAVEHNRDIFEQAFGVSLEVTTIPTTTPRD